MTSPLEAAVERLTAEADGLAAQTDVMPYVIYGKGAERAADLRLVLSRLSALEREVKAWRAFVPAFSEQEPGWTDKMLEVSVVRAATDATAGEM